MNKSAYRSGVRQIEGKRGLLRFTRYRDGAIVGQTFAPRMEVKIPDWSAWTGGGIVGFLLGLILGRR